MANLTIAEELLEIMVQKRALERREKEIKAKIKKTLKGPQTIIQGGAALVVSEQTRYSYDMDSIKLQFGEREIDAHKKAKTITKIEVRAA